MGQVVCLFGAWKDSINLTQGRRAVQFSGCENNVSYQIIHCSGFSFESLGDVRSEQEEETLLLMDVRNLTFSLRMICLAHNRPFK